MTRFPRVDLPEQIEAMSENTWLSSLAGCLSCRSEQWVREMMAGEKRVSVLLPRDSGVSESLQRILQPVVGEVGVDFGGGYVTVAERPLHQQQVGRAGVEVRGKRMSQAVRCDVLGDACLLQPVAQALSYLPGGYSGPARRDEQGQASDCG